MFSAISAIAQNRNRSVLTYPECNRILASSVGQQVSDLGFQVTQKPGRSADGCNSVGYRFNARVNRDVLFEELYNGQPTPENIGR
jgi:hypothetical protein